MIEGMSGRTERWFDAGAGALRRTLTAHGFTDEVAELDRRFPDGGYACPCCLVAYGRGALADEPRTLTEEHVPPELAGGRELLLTCAQCNNASGRVWDIHASRHQHLHDAVLGRSGDSVQATLTIGDFPVRGRFDGSGAVPSFKYVPEVNDPAVATAAGAFLEQIIGAGMEIEFQVGYTRRIDGDAAAWSWIRSAYLAAFAVYGYRFALLRVLEPVRLRLASPQPAPAPQLVVEVPSMPSGPPRMFLVREPEHLRGLMVSFGRVRVFLPAWHFPRQVGDIEQGVIALPPGANPQLLAAEVAWPTEPQYLLDHRL
jgi:hypothetical protein